MIYLVPRKVKSATQIALQDLYVYVAC